MVQPQRVADTKQQPMENIIGLSILAVTCLLSGCRQNRNGVPGAIDFVLPPNWKPSSGVTQEYFSERLEGLNDPLTLTVLTTQGAILSDAGLFQLYVRLWVRLDADGRTRLVRGNRHGWSNAHRWRTRATSIPRGQFLQGCSISPTRRLRGNGALSWKGGLRACRSFGRCRSQGRDGKKKKSGRKSSRRCRTESRF
jgi:hypothetical protein